MTRPLAHHFQHFQANFLAKPLENRVLPRLPTLPSKCDPMCARAHVHGFRKCLEVVEVLEVRGLPHDQCSEISWQSFWSAHTKRRSVTAKTYLGKTRNGPMHRPTSAPWIGHATWSDKACSASSLCTTGRAGPAFLTIFLCASFGNYFQWLGGVNCLKGPPTGTDLSHNFWGRKLGWGGYPNRTKTTFNQSRSIMKFTNPFTQQSEI
jgi:hypothetical protein